MKRALLIGSEVHGLRGVANDLCSMEAVLRDVWGFDDIQVCEGTDASRAGILSALEALIGRATAQDIAVVYYSGHGGRAREIDLGEKRYRNAEPLPEFIAPTDIDHSQEGDFRGITSLEMSLLAAELWQKTGNVTTIMDCCHSGIMVRGPGATRGKKRRPTAIARFLPDCSIGIAGHLTELKQSQRMTLVKDGKASRIVRVSACTPAQVAYETENDEGEITGILTQALQHELAVVHGKSLSWRFVGTQITTAMRGRRMGRPQNPTINGPIDRLVFGLHKQNTQGVAAIYYNKGKTRGDKSRTLCLQAGSLVGVHEGDEYVIMPLHRPLSPVEERRASATVDKVYPGYSTLTITSRKNPNEILISSSPARLVKTNRPTVPVIVNRLAESKGDLRQAIAESMYLHVAGPGDEDSAVAEIDALDDGLALSINHSPLEQKSERKPMWSKPRPTTPEGIQALVGDLERWAHARTLLALGGTSEPTGFASDFIIDWGHVVEGKGVRCDGQGVTLYQNDHLYVRLYNPGARKVYASVFHVGLTGDIALLTSVSGAGIELEPERQWLVGTRYSRLKGWPLGWPLEAADDGPRVEHLVAVLSDRPLDLRVLETAEPKERRVRDVIVGLKIRDRLRYRVERIDYRLSPERRPSSPEGSL